MHSAAGVTMLFGFGGFLQMTHFLCPKLVSYFKSHVNPMIPPSKRISGSTIGTNLLSCKIMVALSASTNTSKWLNAHCDCDILTLNWEKAALRAIPHAASFNSQCRWGHWKLEQVLTWGHKQRPFSLKKCDMIWTLTLVYFGRCYFVVFLCLLLFISCQFIIFIVANFCIQFFGYSSRKK